MEIKDIRQLFDLGIEAIAPEIDKISFENDLAILSIGDHKVKLPISRFNQFADKLAVDIAEAEEKVKKLNDTMGKIARLTSGIE